MPPDGKEVPGGSVRYASLRTLPPFPASSLRENLSPAGPSLFPWPRGATPPGTSFPSRLMHHDPAKSCRKMINKGLFIKMNGQFLTHSVKAMKIENK